MEKDVFRLVTSVGQRKILSPHEESNLRPSDLRSDALPLSHRDSTVSEVYYEVHMTRVLHTARISNVDSVMFVNRIKKCNEVHMKPMRRRTSDLRIPHSDALPLSHRNSTVSEVCYEVHMTRILFTNMTLSTLMILAVCRTRDI